MTITMMFTETTPDDTEYRLLTRDGVTVENAGKRRFLVIQPAALATLAETAFADVSHLFRPGHLAQLQKILDDPKPRTMIVSSPPSF